MEKEKSELERLLNSLIEKGWNPRQHTDFVRCNYCDTYSEFSFETENESGIGEHTLRQLVSKESGLWQFVCENGMVKENDDVRIKNYQGDNECDTNCCYDDYEYRLIETSLKNEDELEQFLLDNIKID